MTLLSRILTLAIKAGEKWPFRKAGIKAVVTFTPFSRFVRFSPDDHEKAEGELVSLGLFLLRISRAIHFVLARDVAMMAEIRGDEASFRKAMKRALDDALRAEALLADRPDRAHSLFNFYLAIMDFQSARRVAEKARLHMIGQENDLTGVLDRLEQECHEWLHVIHSAGQNLKRRVAGDITVSSEAVLTGNALTLYIPMAAFRSNPNDYPGFRKDIRSVFRDIVSVLERRGVEYNAVARLARHGVIRTAGPCISYHSHGDGNGLHIKETDRRSYFSADPAGFSGWSDFSLRPIPAPEAADRETIRKFIEIERKLLIDRNESKYRQPEATTGINPGKPYVLIPFQIIDDVVQRLAHLHMFEMLEDVASTCKTKGIPLVVKRHPLCRSIAVEHVLKRGVKHGLLTISNASIHSLISNACAVCVINSGTGAEALLHGKPVYTFGAAEYQAATFNIRRRGEFAAMFEPHRLPNSPAQIENLLYCLRQSYAVNIRDRPEAIAFWEKSISARNWVSPSAGN